MSVYSSRWAAAVVIATLILTPVPGYAAIRSRDQTSTSAYLDALYQLLQAEKRELPASEMSARALINTVSRGCPAMVTGVHHTKQAALLSIEMGGALTVVMTGPDRPDIARFVRTVSVLRWSDPRVGPYVRAYLHKLTAEIRATHMPNLCADVRVWVQSDFQKVDSHTTQFVRERQAAEAAGLEAVPKRLLRKYEGGKERRLLQEIKKTERYLEGPALKILLAAWDRLLKVIGL